MNDFAEHPVFEFSSYPPVGADDWRYAFAAAQVRSMQAQMLSKTLLANMANAENFEAALDCLSSTEYAQLSASKDMENIEEALLEKRSYIRRTVCDLFVDEIIGQLFKARTDLVNMRLAIRRTVTDKSIGVDYSNDGNVGAELLEQIFEQENYDLLPEFLVSAVENAVLSYYDNDHDVRQIDYSIDIFSAEFQLATAQRLNNSFMTELFKMQIDLINIQTMLRLKYRDQADDKFFIAGGYLEPKRLGHCLDLAYEAIAPLFFATPYHDLITKGVAYLAANDSFLVLEQQCSEHLMGFLKTADQITAGSQPLISYLLAKENEIRNIRMILTAKKNLLDTKMILDRLGAAAA